jgi:hypothetical protein
MLVMRLALPTGVRVEQRPSNGAVKIQGLDSLTEAEAIPIFFAAKTLNHSASSPHPLGPHCRTPHGGVCATFQDEVYCTIAKEGQVRSFRTLWAVNGTPALRVFAGFERQFNSPQFE